MPTISKNTMQIDDNFFRNAVSSYIGSKTPYNALSYNELIEYYEGDNRRVAELLVESGAYTNIRSAQRQLLRMKKNPNLNLTKRTQEKLLKLQANITNVDVTIRGWFSYDITKGWKFATFKVKNVSKEQFREIILLTLEDQQTGLDMLLQDTSYGMPVSVVFASGVTVSIDER